MLYRTGGISPGVTFAVKKIAPEAQRYGEEKKAFPLCLRD